MKKILFCLSLLSITACSSFEPGGSFNPLRIEPISAFITKAGSNNQIFLSLGEAPKVGLQPAALFRASNDSSILLSGSKNIFVNADLATLETSILPENWNLRFLGDEVELIATSSSISNAETINTVTQVALGRYRMGATLNIPKDSKPGTYFIEGRISIRNLKPVLVNWKVTITN